MDGMNEGSESGTDDRTATRLPVARRAVLRAAGATTALGLGVGSAAADEHEPADGPATDGDDGGMPAKLDPLFGYASADPNPCGDDAGADCFEAFPAPVRPAHEVEMNIDLPDALLAIGRQGALSDVTTQSINESVADGTVDRETLHRPDAAVDFETPQGTQKLTVEAIAGLVADTLGFYFDPAGLRVEPGDVVLFSAESPDHAVVPYHERHGRQNRVPDGVGPFSSPLVPVGGYWLYRFETPGVYDCYCPPHDPFGMVCRVVVTEGDVPDPSIENVGRPPPAHNDIAGVLGGLDPNLPSSMAALNADALSPANVVESGRVAWADVVAAHRRDA
jgi:plastocyanin